MKNNARYLTNITRLIIGIALVSLAFGVSRPDRTFPKSAQNLDLTITTIRIIDGQVSEIRAELCNYGDSPITVWSGALNFEILSGTRIWRRDVHGSFRLAFPKEVFNTPSPHMVALRKGEKCVLYCVGYVPGSTIENTAELFIGESYWRRETEKRVARLEPGLYIADAAINVDLYDPGSTSPDAKVAERVTLVSSNKVWVDVY